MVKEFYNNNLICKIEHILNKHKNKLNNIIFKIQQSTEDNNIEILYKIINNDSAKDRKFYYDKLSNLIYFNKKLSANEIEKIYIGYDYFNEIN